MSTFECYYVVGVEDLEHFLHAILLDGVGLALLVAEERAAQGDEIHERHQAVTARVKRFDVKSTSPPRDVSIFKALKDRPPIAGEKGARR